MEMAVRHLVCVFEGAPGPVQGPATAMLQAAKKAMKKSDSESTRWRVRGKIKSLGIRCLLEVVKSGWQLATVRNWAGCYPICERQSNDGGRGNFWGCPRGDLAGALCEKS